MTKIATFNSEFQVTMSASFSSFQMKLSKAQVVRVVKETAIGVDKNLTREEKQQVFNNVVDGLLRDGRITKKQQLRAWTHPF